VEDLVHLERDTIADVMANELEVVPVQEVTEVMAPAREEVVEADDLVSVRDEALAEVRAEEPCAACHENAFAHLVLRNPRRTYHGPGAGPSC
jgi:hypothetical protein